MSSLKTTLYSYHDVGLLLLRIAVGASFLAHGTMKWAMLSAPAAGFVPNVMKVLAFGEPLGALAVILGLFGRTASACLTIVMIGAISIKSQNGFALTGKSGSELELVLLCANIALMLIGPGKWSIEGFMKKK